MKILVGLGNPGSQYENTRHNFGFSFIDALAEQLNASFKASRVKALEAQGNYGSAKVLLLKPQTFMNLSGEAVAGILRFYKKEVADLLIVYDDLDIELGRIKFAAEGSSGGHKGIQSIIECLGTKVFDRLRLGISKAPVGMNPADYVLRNFGSGEKPLMRKVIDASLKALDIYFDKGITAAMNHANGQLIV